MIVMTSIWPGVRARKEQMPVQHYSAERSEMRFPSPPKAIG